MHDPTPRRPGLVDNLGEGSSSTHAPFALSDSATWDEDVSLDDLFDDLLDAYDDDA